MNTQTRAAKMTAESQKARKSPPNMMGVKGGKQMKAGGQMSKMEGPMCSTFRGPLKGGC